MAPHRCAADPARPRAGATSSASSSGRNWCENKRVATFAWFTGSDMRGKYRTHVLLKARGFVSFRRRWSARTDSAIHAALNYFWARQNAALKQKEKDDVTRASQSSRK
jgi:hypothetical protein